MDKQSLNERLSERVSRALKNGSTEIAISGDGPVDLSVLQRLPELERLELECGEADYRPLADLKHLKELLLQSDTQSDIKPLAKLTKLELLDLTDGQVSDLTPISGLPNLRDASFRWCSQLEDLKLLAPVVSLQRLTLHECASVVELTPLSRCSNLQYLNLVDCDGITDLSPLRSLDHLRTLVVDETTIETDLSVLASMTDLRVVHWEDEEGERAGPSTNLNPQLPAKPCPECGKPLRSALAQQCLECVADWH